MVSIIIPSRFRPDLTQTCIDSVIKYTKDYHLILVQEGNDEELKALLKSYENKEIGSGRIVYVQNEKPLGFSGAMNTGMRLTVAACPVDDFYCFLNNDTVATPGWMDNMLKVMEKDKEIGLVSPTFYGAPTHQSPDWNDGKEVEYVYDPLRLMGVCFLIRKGAMEMIQNPIGHWDEAFGLGGEEDYDMAIRIQNAGYSLAIARKSFIYHYVGASFKELFDNDLEMCRDHARKNFHLLEEKHKIKIISE